MKHFHVLMIMIGAVSISAPAFADVRDEVLAGAERCAAITDYRTWLDCYYGAAQPMRNVLGLPPAPSSQTRLVPELSMTAPQRPVLAPPPAASSARPAARKSGGFLGGVLGGTLLVNNVPASQYSFDKHGLFTLTLTDGEVWKQMDDDSVFAKWRAPASNYLVTVKSGALGSFNLTVKNDGTLYRVRRIR